MSCFCLGFLEGRYEEDRKESCTYTDAESVIINACLIAQNTGNPMDHDGAKTIKGSPGAYDRSHHFSREIISCAGTVNGKYGTEKEGQNTNQAEKQRPRTPAKQNPNQTGRDKGVRHDDGPFSTQVIGEG
jgi:hypothetical protein